MKKHYRQFSNLLKLFSSTVKQQQQQQTSSCFSTSFCQFVSHSQTEKSFCFFWLTEKNTCWGEQVSLLLLGKLKNRNGNGHGRKRALSFQSVSRTVSRTTFLVCNVDFGGNFFFFSTETFFNWHWTFTMLICVLVCVCVLFRFLYFEVLRKKRGIVWNWFFLICWLTDWLFCCVLLNFVILFVTVFFFLDNLLFWLFWTVWFFVAFF